MNLRGQHGYAMVALLVALSIMADLMTVAMPTWRQAAQREKEAELIFRGQQYARAIGLVPEKSRTGCSSPKYRRPGRRPLPAQEIQGSDHRARTLTS